MADDDDKEGADAPGTAPALDALAEAPRAPIADAAPAIAEAATASAPAPVPPEPREPLLARQAPPSLASPPAPPALSPVAPSLAPLSAAAPDVADDGTSPVPPLLEVPGARAAPSLGARLRGVRRELFLAALVLGPVSITTVAVAIASRHEASGRAVDHELASETAPAPAVVANPSELDAGSLEHALVFAIDAAPPPSAPPPVWRVVHLAGDTHLVTTDGAIGKRPFVTALAAAGVSRNDVHRLLAAMGDLRSFDRLNAKDTFSAVRDKKSGKLVAFELVTSPSEVWQARANESGGLEAKKLDIKIDRLPVAVAITVNEDLRESIVKAGLDGDLLKMLDEALHSHVELASVRNGARLRVVGREEKIDGAFVRYGELEAVEYLAPNAHTAPLRVYHYGAGKSAGFYDAKGRQPFHGGWRSPVPLARLSSRFNPRRMHPVLHVIAPHNGVDFAAPPGTPVYATAPGSIRIAGDGGPCGNMIQILHSNGLVSAYCHLSRFAGVHIGQHVEGRQLIGYVGQTGRATGPHLHFAVKRGEAFIDPMAMKLDGVRVLPPAEREDFAKQREELDARLDAIMLPVAAYPDGGSDEAGEQETILDDPP